MIDKRAWPDKSHVMKGAVPSPHVSVHLELLTIGTVIPCFDVLRRVQNC